MRSRLYFRASSWWLFGLVLLVNGVAADEVGPDKKGAAADASKSGDHAKKSGDHAKKKAGNGEEDANHTGDSDGHGGDHAGGHAHDETDLGHGFAGPNMEKPEEFRSDLAIYTFVVFVLLLLILKFFAWGPIMDGLERRETAIAQAIASAEKNAAEAEARAAQYETKLAEAAEEARAVVAEARQDAETARERILAEAEQARQRDRERFLADIENAKNAAIGEVAQRGTEIAVSLASQIVRREIKAGDHATLIKDSLDRFPSNN